MERITGVAVKVGGLIFSQAAPNRHHTCLRMAIAAIGEDKDHQQGFTTSEGRYVGRKEAKDIAEASGQMKPRQEGQYDGELLFSEDVW